MRAAIVGTGWLGQQIHKDISLICDDVILTHFQNKRFSNSKKFDFFNDNIGEIFGDKKVDLVFLPTKIEFIKDENALKSAMIRFLKKCGASRIIYISSDGIFNGKKGLYKENDVPTPVTAYGRNLKICEDLVKKMCKNYCIVRPSYLYSANVLKLDNRLNKIKDDIKNGSKIVRFTNMYKSPLSYEQAAEAIVKAALLDFIGTVHISGKRMSVYDFAKECVRALKLLTENLIGEAMPSDRPVDFLPDTSLDCHLMEELIGIQPLGIKESFNKFSV